MQTTSFTRLVEAVRRLSPQQIAKLDEVLTFERRRVHAVITLDERAGHGGAVACCQKCGGSERARWGRTRTGAQRWRCAQCNSTWSGLTATPIAGIHRPDLFLELVKNMFGEGTPLSCRKAAARLGVSRHTIWRWRMRILRMLPGVSQAALSGIVEADETRQRESRKASREWARHKADPAKHPQPPREPWRFYTSRNATVTTPPGGWRAWDKNLLAMTDRSGNRAFEAIPSVSQVDVQAVLVPAMAPDAVLCTDGHATYQKIAKGTAIEHFALNGGSRLPGESKAHHINTVNSLQQRYREFIRMWRGPATPNLKAYGRWFAARENARGDFLPIFKAFLGNPQSANTVC